MANAVMYARFSSDNQDQNSIDLQFRACREAAKRNGDEVVAEYKDEGVSGTTAEREHFRRMMTDIRSGAIRVNRLYVYSFSRLMRDRIQAGIEKRRLREMGVEVRSATEPLPEDEKTAEMIEGIIDTINQYQSRDIGEKSLDGSMEVARNGYWTGGPAPYGYRLKRVPNAEGHRRGGEIVIRTRLEIEPDEAKWVKRIFELSATTGWGGWRIYKEICKEAGHPVLGRKGKPLGGGGVNQILRNPIYKGMVIYNDHGYRKVLGSQEV